METDLFENLPREIMVEILHRVADSRSIIKCKVVQKAWRDVVESQEFAYRCMVEGDSCRHLMLFIDRCRYGIMELDDESSHPDYYYMKGAEVVNSELRDAKSYAEPLLRSSVDGLILLMRHDGRFKHILICNPMTDEYVTLPSPPNYCIFIEEIGYYFGFGKSMRSKQYKVVGITIFVGEGYECQVYSIGEGEGEGEGSWRSISCESLTARTGMEKGSANVGGNLHWLQSTDEGMLVVWCFDLEREVFTSFPGPPDTSTSYRANYHHRAISDLDGCLCFCQDETYGGSVWLMRDYGTKCWTKTFCISSYSNGIFSDSCLLFPIRLMSGGGYGDGMLIGDGRGAVLFYYSFNTNIYHCCGWFPNLNDRLTGEPLLLTPTFLSLRTQLLMPQMHYDRF